MIKRLMPKEYRPLLEYISPAAFKVIDWKKAMAQFLELSKHAFDKGFVESLARSNINLFSPDVLLEITRSSSQSKDQVISDGQFADLILDIYFSQFFSEQGVLLDLRLKHFENEQGFVSFDPGSFVHVFEPEFRSGMLDIYEGYYLKRPEKMERGMLAVGLVTSSDSAEIEETRSLLFSHFGEADQGPIEFNLEHYKKSFHELFLHLKTKNIRLSADFLFLGIYLVTLYLALSKLGRPVDVKKCFLGSWNRNSN